MDSENKPINTISGRGGVRPGSGRKPGSPNKTTKEFRETINKMLEANADSMAAWLNDVAYGNEAAGVKADPAKALDLLCKLAEYAAPKLSRTEFVGNDGGPLETVTRIELVPLDGG